jgi:hypothetical protein
VMDGLGLWIAIGMGWVKFKDGSLMNNVNFRPEQGLYFDECFHGLNDVQTS